MGSVIQFFGQHLISHAVVSQAQLDDAVDYQRAVNLPLGALALSKALLSERQVLLIHTQQRRTDQPFGEIAVQRGFITRDQLDELLKEQAEARILLGEALVQKGHLTRDQLNEALIDYHAAQGEAERQVKQALEHLPEADLARLVTEITTRMLLRLAGQVCKVQEVFDARPPAEAHWFWMTVTGDMPFTFALTVDDHVLLRIGKVMLESVPDVPQPAAVDDLVKDAGKEFVNVTVGHICSMLSREGLKTMPEPVERVEGADLAEAEGTWMGIQILLTQGIVRVGVRL
jgi:hypothetical protein